MNNHGSALREYVSYEEALKIILAETNASSSEVIPISNLLGRVIAQDIYAREDLPAGDIASRDGFAVSRRMAIA